MIIFPDFEENLEIEDGKCLTGMRQYVVTSRDKSNITKDEFCSKSYITINEMNHILERHNAEVKDVTLDYTAKNCIVVSVCFNDDESVLDVPAVPKQKKQYPNTLTWQKENLTMEDGRVLNGSRIYCVTSQKRVNQNRDTYWRNQYVTLNEMNHILSSHNAIVKSFLPVYKTGTEAFVHVYFKDDPSVTPKEPLPIQEIPEPESFEKKIRRYMEGFKKPEDDLTIEDGKTLKGARIYYVTSYKKNNLTKEYFFKYGCFSEKEYFHIRENHRSTAEEMFTVHNEVPCYFAVLNFED